jgi:hypothetical protein
MINMAARNLHQQRIIEVLEEALMPMDVENIRLRAGLKNWESTKAILLEMVLQGMIIGQKTTKSWIFWVGSTATNHERQPRIQPMIKTD